jgi:hypothetical protein
MRQRARIAERNESESILTKGERPQLPGYLEGDSLNYWDHNWIHVAIEVRVGAFEGRYQTDSRPYQSGASGGSIDGRNRGSGEVVRRAGRSRLRYGSADPSEARKAGGRARLS